MPQVDTVLGQADLTCPDVLDGYVAGAPSAGCLPNVDNVKSLVLTPRKMSSFLQSSKNDLGLKTSGIYSIPCECPQVYRDKTGVCNVYRV
jgi:hypothetical protein